MVQLNCQKVHRCIIGISIHLMLWFNFLVIRVGTKLSEFQYILCYGSTTKYIFCLTKLKHFNTSYVMVQQQYERYNLNF